MAVRFCHGPLIYKNMHGFKKWLWKEGSTFAHDLKLVYHWPCFCNTLLQLLSVSRNFPSKKSVKNMRQYDPEALKRVYALWVGPNKNMNQFWAGWIVSANDHQYKSYYLHTIGMPTDPIQPAELQTP